MKVLYAEDDAFLRKSVAYSFIRMGHEVVTVDNGKEAVEVLKEEEFDFIILDVFMPYLSGIEVVQYARGEMKINTPILMLSRSDDENLVKQALQAGANEYVKKPMEPDFLLLKVKKYTGQASG